MKKWINDQDIDTMDWPPYSPDLNPIEHAWFRLKEGVYVAVPGIEDLRGGKDTISRILADACKTSWETIEDSFLETLIESMPRRVAAVIVAEGGYTKY